MVKHHDCHNVHLLLLTMHPMRLLTVRHLDFHNARQLWWATRTAIVQHHACLNEHQLWSTKRTVTLAWHLHHCLNERQWPFLNPTAVQLRLCRLARRWTTRRHCPTIPRHTAMLVHRPSNRQGLPLLLKLPQVDLRQILWTLLLSQPHPEGQSATFLKFLTKNEQNILWFLSAKILITLDLSKVLRLMLYLTDLVCRKTIWPRFGKLTSIM